MPQQEASLEDRFWAKVLKTEGCWIWTASLRQGYGQFSIGGKRIIEAHRYAYELLISPIPQGFEIDHLCRNRPCVNPQHLEAVTHQVNDLRGISPPAVNARKAFCVHGHPFDLENTYYESIARYRRCRVCHKLNERMRKARLRPGHPLEGRTIPHHILKEATDAPA